MLPSINLLELMEPYYCVSDKDLAGFLKDNPPQNEMCATEVMERYKEWKLING